MIKYKVFIYLIYINLFIPFSSLSFEAGKDKRKDKRIRCLAFINHTASRLYGERIKRINEIDKTAFLTQKGINKPD